MKSCPRFGSIVEFQPRPGILKYYVRNAAHMKRKPLARGDVGLVRGQSADDIPGHRVTAVVEVARTGRLHEIDCQDLRLSRRR